MEVTTATSNNNNSSSFSSRPVSRRGGTDRVSGDNNNMMIMNNETSNSPNVRPATGYRGMSARPPSSLRTGTASRLTAQSQLTQSPASGGMSQRIGTSIGFAGNMMTERPLTQHGLSGLPSTSIGRTGTASGMRQIKDKRYWKAQLQMKINEIHKEMDKLGKETQAMERERSAKKTFERKVKLATKELTELQAQLTEMNIVLDAHNNGMTRQQIQQEATVLQERNESLQTDVERLFIQRQTLDDENREWENKIEIEKNKINEMIYSLSSEDQKKYRKLQQLSEDLRKQKDDMHAEIDSLNKQKESLESTVATSPARIEAVRLYTKLNEQQKKLNVLQSEEDNRLSPAEEREKLIAEVRANNQALASIGRQQKLIDDQLREKRDLLQKIEQDLEEGNSEKHAKYLELKRRDDTMTAFMESFEENLENERKNVDLLKNQITYAIEQMTLQGINLKQFGISNPSTMDEENDLSSHEGLSKEHKRLTIQLKQLQLLEKRTDEQLRKLQSENISLNEEIEKFSNLEILRADVTMQSELISAELEELKNKERITEDVVKEAENRNENIKDELRGNETYRQISHLEEKLTDLLRENDMQEEFITKEEKKFDYSGLKNDCEEKLNKLLGALNYIPTENN